MHRRAMLELGAVAAGTVMGWSVEAAEHPKRSAGSRLTTRDGVGLHCSDWGQGKPIVFGTATEILLSELVIEIYYPADASSDERLQQGGQP